MKKEQKGKKSLILPIVLIIVFFILLFLLNLSDTDNSSEENSSNNNQITEENTENFIDINENETNNTNENNENLDLDTQEENILQDSEEEIESQSDEDENLLYYDIRLSTYFLTKYCLDTYYNSYNLTTKLSLLDEDARYVSSSLVSEWIDKNYYSVKFSIDELYTQEISDNMSIILVYYRYTTDNETCESAVMAIRVDVSNYTFSMYPYEYIKEKGYDNLRIRDKISVDKTESIEKNSYNQYDMDEIETTGLACTQELFEKLKFSLLVDSDIVYYMLDEEYRNLKFPTMQDWEEYLEKNKESLLNEELTKYRVERTSDCVQFAGITNNNRYIYFELSSCLMNYTIFLDNYTIVKLDTYDDVVATWQAPYCLNRVFSAINEQDYLFLYEHLSTTQKNNYYNTQEEFEEYMKSIFYNCNSFEIDDEYLTVTGDIYQYTVYVTNEEDSSQTKTLTMTVELGEETDFEVAINIKE